MKGFLIPYIDPKKMKGHEDPMLPEFTYGDVGRRGKKLREYVSIGDCLFFHTSSRGKRVLSAYYIVERVIPILEARQDRLIMAKYKNPHLYDEIRGNFDTIVIGNPITSCWLQRPFVLTKELFSHFSKDLNFNSDQTDLAAMSSTLRNWIKIDENDVDFLLEQIQASQNEFYSKENIFLSSHEIAALDETEIEQFLVKNPTLLSKNTSVYKQQFVFPSGKRLDLLLKRNDDESHLILVEIKKDMITKDAYKQISGYIKETKQSFDCNKVEGIIVCSGIHPVFENFYLKKIQEKKVNVYQYGWRFDTQSYSSL